jgi:hypothetical protein
MPLNLESRDSSERKLNKPFSDPYSPDTNRSPKKSESLSRTQSKPEHRLLENGRKEIDIDFDKTDKSTLKLPPSKPTKQEEPKEKKIKYTPAPTILALTTPEQKKVLVECYS